MDDEIPGPNLFLVGAMKAGTTSLHTYLAQHSDIFMTNYKEPQFFVLESNWHRGESWYLKNFWPGRDRAVRGESSTAYTKAPHHAGVPERIARFSPDARILYLMRDPVERTISHYWWAVQYEMEWRSMPVAVRESAALTDYSNYAMQIRPYIELFGSDRVHALTTEALRDRPEATMTAVYRFLGLDPHVPDTSVKHNVSKPTVGQVKGARLLARLRGTPIWRARNLISSKTKWRLLQLLARPVARGGAGRAETVEYLRGVQRGQVAELSELLGRDFPEWTTLHGAQAPVRALTTVS